MSMFYIGAEDKQKNSNSVDLDSLDEALPGSSVGNQDVVLKQKFDIMRQAAERTSKQSRGMSMITSSRPISSRGYRASSTATPRLPIAPASEGGTFGLNDLDEDDDIESIPSIPSTTVTTNVLSASTTSGFNSTTTSNSPRPSTATMVSTPQDKKRERDNVEKVVGFTSFDPLAEEHKSPKIQLETPTSRSALPSEEDDDFEGVAGLNIRDLKAFVSKPPPNHDQWVRCYILRDTSKMNKVFPKYYMYAERGSTFLLSGKKRKGNKSSNYCVSLSKEDISRNSDSFIGKLRSNFIGTEFQLYDNGEKSSKMKSGTHLRNHLASIVYETNLFGSKGPRKFTVVIPDANDENDQYQFPDNGSSLITKFKNGDWHHLKVLKNKFPVWNERLKAYVLNFNGRVTMASVKNFQLVEPNNPNRVYLQFGKVDEDRFNIDFKYPLTAMQAFSIAISSFDSKLACE